MNVLSLFDGMSCGQIALDQLGIKVDNYYASEIDENAIKITKHNYPNTIHLGDVTNINANNLPTIDLLIGGSPCQDLSVAMKNREGLEGQKSKLFFEYIRVFKETNPKYFLFENVGGMKEEDKNIISNLFGVAPIKINSQLVSPALRNRLYWTNIPNVKQPSDKKIKLQDILESGYTDREKARALLSSDSRPLTTKSRMMHRYRSTGFTTLIFENPNFTEESCRYMTQTELERCMTIPDGYTKIVSRNQAAHHLGNGWTVEVIKHIFKNMEE
jgi:DNA (cytosine-5)-methyltransferase 3A